MAFTHGHPGTREQFTDVPQGPLLQLVHVL